MDILKTIASDDLVIFMLEQGIFGKIMLALLCTVLFIAIASLLYLVFIIIRDMLYSKKCIVCRDVSTLNRNEKGEPVCKDCKSIEKAKQSEKSHACLNDGFQMTKQVVQGIVVDKCPRCGGVWLEQDEIEKLVNIIESSDDSSSHFTGFATGLIIGKSM
jgi:hypothetical protein